MMRSRAFIWCPWRGKSRGGPPHGAGRPERGRGHPAGGAFKPRTSPYAFQGLGHEGLAMLREAADAAGMPCVTEVVEVADVEPVDR